MLAGKEDKKIIGCDIKPCHVVGPGTYIYEQDVTQREDMQAILDRHSIDKFDVIVSDMAPDTIGQKSIDAMRSIGLVEKILWIFDSYLKASGTFCIKIFMGPGFDELVGELKKRYGNTIVTYKPKSSRDYSKEIFIIKK
jgi:23S rRNA (uridine2552-2'-O)-methyltransferase